MPRHARYVPHVVIPAVLLPFNDDLSIDEKSFRAHLRDVAATKGISAITINAHSTEVASLSFEEQRRVLAIAQDEIGERLPLVNGVWADGSIEAARIARMAAEGGASALLIFPPGPFTLGQSPQMALAHFKRIADATDLPLTVFRYPLARAFYADPWSDMHNRMKEALVLLGRLSRAVVRPPLVKLSDAEIERLRTALAEAGLMRAKARDAA